jgi:hypothetical protein
MVDFGNRDSGVSTLKLFTSSAMAISGVEDLLTPVPRKQTVHMNYESPTFEEFLFNTFSFFQSDFY